MALTSVSFSWRRKSLVVSRTARVMFGREFISIILRNLSSILPALRDVNRNSGRDPYPKISVKNYLRWQTRALEISFKNYMSAKAEHCVYPYQSGGGNCLSKTL